MCGSHDWSIFVLSKWSGRHAQTSSSLGQAVWRYRPVGGHMLRKFTIARYVETGEIVEDSLAGWNLDPISEVGLVGGIWKCQWIIANEIRDYYFPFITVPLCQ